MVGKLRHFADKMILIKRHQSASLDKKSTDILPKTKQKKTMKGDISISQVKNHPPQKANGKIKVNFTLKMGKDEI